MARPGLGLGWPWTAFRRRRGRRAAGRGPSRSPMTGGSANDPRTWLALFEVAVTQNVPVSADAIAAIKRAAPTVSPEALLPDDGSRQRFLRWLRPRSGLSGRLAEMHASGLLAVLFPELGRPDRACGARDWRAWSGCRTRRPLPASGSGVACSPRSPSRKRSCWRCSSTRLRGARAGLRRPSARDAAGDRVPDSPAFEEMARVAFRRDAEDPGRHPRVCWPHKHRRASKDARAHHARQSPAR